MLFFASTQVYFSCHSGTLSEAVRDDLVESTLGIKDGKFQSAVNLVKLGPGLFAAGERARATGNHFIDDRSSYTRRQLTFSGDILDAYRGLLRRSACHSFWGVSILPECPSRTTTNITTTTIGKAATSNTRSTARGAAAHLGLAHGLIWLTNVRKPKARRAGFPTWSWTSIDGHVVSYSWRGALSPGGKFIGPAPNYSPAMRSSSVEFWIYDSVGTLRCLPELLVVQQQQQQRDFLLPETSRALVVEGEFVTVHILTASSREQRQVRTMDRRRVVFCGAKASSACLGLHDGDDGKESVSVACDISIDCPEPIMTTTSNSSTETTSPSASTAHITTNTAQGPRPRKPPVSSPCTDALILVSYKHERNRTLHGSVLMLLRWKAHNVAERVGLLRIEGPVAAGDLFGGFRRTRRGIRLE